MATSYTDAAPHLALVARLETVLGSCRTATEDSAHNDGDGDSQEAEAILTRLADALRDESIRELVGISSLPSVATALLRSKLGFTSQTDVQSTATQWYEESPSEDAQIASLPLILQIGRVAANLAIDNDANRQSLIEHGYPQTALAVLATELPLRSDPVALNAVKSIVASLLNLSFLENSTFMSTLSSSRAVDLMLSIANGLYSPGEWAFSKSTDDVHARAQIAEWLWTIVTNVTESEDGTVDIEPRILVQLLPPLLSFLPSPERISPPSSNELHALRGPDLRILRSASQLLETFTLDSPTVCKALPSIRLPLAPTLALAEQGALDTQSVLNILLLFVERAEPPAFWRTPPPADSQVISPVSPVSPVQGKLQPDKWATKLGMCKAAVVKAIVEVCAEIDMNDPSLETFWPHMHKWLAGDVQERDDLAACALLCFGNAARAEPACVSLLSAPDSIAPRLVELLSPSSDVKLQHALAVLGDAGVITGLSAMKAWAKERDLLGSVQGGAIGVVKHLCNGNAENALRAVDTVVDEILSLVQRTDDVAMRCEGTRVCVNVIRTLCSAAGQPGGSARTAEALKRLGSEDVVEALSQLVRTGGKYPILVNEGVVSLALLVAFGENGVASTVVAAINAEHAVPALQTDKAVDATVLHLAPPATTADVLAYVMAPTPSSSSSPVITPELQQNVCTLLSNLSRRGQAGDELKGRMTQGLEAVAAHGTGKAKDAATAVLQSWGNSV